MGHVGGRSHGDGHRAELYAEITPIGSLSRVDAPVHTGGRPSAGAGDIGVLPIHKRRVSKIVIGGVAVIGVRPRVPVVGGGQDI